MALVSVEHCYYRMLLYTLLMCYDLLMCKQSFKLQLVEVEVYTKYFIRLPHFVCKYAQILVTTSFPLLPQDKR